MTDLLKQINALLAADPACNGRVSSGTVEAIAALTLPDAVAGERERCARIAEEWFKENKEAAKQQRQHGDKSMADRLDGAAFECNALAAAIRKEPS